MKGKKWAFGGSAAPLRYASSCSIPACLDERGRFPVVVESDVTQMAIRGNGNAEGYLRSYL